MMILTYLSFVDGRTGEVHEVARALYAGLQ